MIRRNIKFIVLAGLFIGLVSCGKDNGTGSDPGEPPSIPEIQTEKAQPDISFFQNNAPKSVSKDTPPAQQATSNFYEARSQVLAGAGFFAFADFYSAFLYEADNEDAKFEDGSWVWEYSYQYENQSASIRLVSKEVSGGYMWSMFWSFDDGQGNSVDNYKVMEGTISEDGSQGDWVFNTLNSDTNQEEPAIESQWDVISDTEKTIQVKSYSEGVLYLTADYEENAPEHTMTFTYPNDPNMTIFWNSDTKVGYIEDDGGRKCWDENFQDAPNSPLCS